jgi:hypothetical protein
MKKNSIIIGGDLNFSLGQSKFWCPHARADPLAGFFIQNFSECKLTDVEPTWRNNKVGEEQVVKMLDCFLVADSLT